MPYESPFQFKIPVPVVYQAVGIMTKKVNGRRVLPPSLTPGQVSGAIAIAMSSAQRRGLVEPGHRTLTAAGREWTKNMIGTTEWPEVYDLYERALGKAHTFKAAHPVPKRKRAPKGQARPRLRAPMPFAGKSRVRGLGHAGYYARRKYTPWERDAIGAGFLFARYMLRGRKRMPDVARLRQMYEQENADLYETMSPGKRDALRFGLQLALDVRAGTRDMAYVRQMLGSRVAGVKSRKRAAKAPRGLIRLPGRRAVARAGRGAGRVRRAA
jgi:hypothetical protein